MIGFHGHTILHRPAERRTWQIGDGALLARGSRWMSSRISARPMSRRAVEGAPLAPLFHAALAAPLAEADRRPQHRRRRERDLDRGGVGNPRLRHRTRQRADRRLGAPAHRRRGRSRRRARSRRCRFGGACRAIFSQVPYFDRLPPKSLDRDDFREALPTGLSLEDGAATLTEMTAAAVAAATRHFPAPARQWLVTGGGRHNPALMEALRPPSRSPPCARSKRSAGTATRSRRRPLPISRSALFWDYR